MNTPEEVARLVRDQDERDRRVAADLARQQEDQRRADLQAAHVAPNSGARVGGSQPVDASTERGRGLALEFPSEPQIPAARAAPLPESAAPPAGQPVSLSRSREQAGTADPNTIDMILDALSNMSEPELIWVLGMIRTVGLRAREWSEA